MDNLEKALIKLKEKNDKRLKRLVKKQETAKFRELCKQLNIKIENQ